MHRCCFLSQIQNPYLRGLDPAFTYSPVDLTCSGYCRDCGKVHQLPADRALPHALLLMEQLRLHRRLDFDLPEEGSNPSLSTAGLYTEEQRGKMFGVLVCEDREGNEVILKAFSSKYNGHLVISGWVPPLFDAEQFDAEVEQGNRHIHPLTERILQLEKQQPEYVSLHAERKAVSHQILARLLALYEVNNFNRERRTLRAAFDPEKSLPIGAGDCCAPKLLNAAALNDLKPVSLAEFFWGLETASGDRKEGEFYPSCAERCEPLLGFMLCGTPTEK